MPNPFDQFDEKQSNPFDQFDVGQKNYGQRQDGTQKGLGYFGELKRPDGSVSTELSIGVNFDGNETQIPALVPTLSRDEVDYLIGGGKVTDAIAQKAVEHARVRMSKGLSPFAGEGEQVGLPEKKSQDLMSELSNESMVGLNDMSDEDVKNLKVGVSKIYRPVLEGTGAMLGGAGGAIAGAPGGPVGAFAGAITGGAGGYAVGKGISDTLDIASGIKENPTVVDAFKQAGKDLVTGAEYEVMGQALGAALVPVMKSGKYVFEKNGDAGKYLFTKSGMEKTAGKFLIANTSAGPIYAKNAEEAAALEEAIPGLKFTEGERAYDPARIKAERMQLKKPGDAAPINAERIAANNEALRKYYTDNFGDESGIDDLLNSLSGQKQQLKTAEETAIGAATGEAERLPASAPQVTGQKVVDALKTSKEAAKREVDKLYQKVPDMDIDVSGMVDDFKKITTPRYVDEPSGDIPNLIDRVKNTVNKNSAGKESLIIDSSGKPFVSEDLPKTLKLSDLKGLRSRLLRDAQDAMDPMRPNRVLASRIYEGVSAIENAISKAEGAEGGAAALKEANKFFKENYADVFRKGDIGDILRKGPRGEETRIPLEKIPSKLFDSTNTMAVEQLKKAVGNETAKNLMRDHAAYDLLKNVTDAEGKVISKKLAMWTRKNNQLLTKLGIKDDFANLAKAQNAADEAIGKSAEFEKTVAARVLGADPEKAMAAALKGEKIGKSMSQLVKQVGGDKVAMAGLQKAFADHVMKSIRTTAKDIADNPTISSAAFSRVMDKYQPAINVLYRDSPKKAFALKQMQKAYEIMSRGMKSPIGGGPETAETMLTAAVNKLNIMYRPFTFAKGVWKTFAKYSDEDIDKMITRAMFDADYEATLRNIASGKIRESEIPKTIEDKLMPGIRIGALATQTENYGDEEK